jgi:hypothetical protein
MWESYSHLLLYSLKAEQEKRDSFSANPWSEKMLGFTGYIPDLLNPFAAVSLLAD